jgi:hypothetical protein
MTPESPSPQVLARYAPGYGGGPLWLVAGLAILGFIVYRLSGQSGEEGPLILALLAVLVAGVGVVTIITALVGLRAIEVMASGTIDFVSRTKRESYSRTDLLKIQGGTTALRRSKSHWVRFIFQDAEHKKIEKSVVVSRKDDPALREFVRQLERFNPRLDTAQFWAWSRSAK